MVAVKTQARSCCLVEIPLYHRYLCLIRELLFVMSVRDWIGNAMGMGGLLLASVPFFENIVHLPFGVMMMI